MEDRLPVAIVAIVFTFITIIVALNLVAGLFKAKIKSRDLSQNAERRCAEMGARLSKIEQRLGNIETIVIESEKHREFERKL